MEEHDLPKFRFWSVTYRALPQEEKPFSIDVKGGEKTSYEERASSQGEFCI
jgi:hypothetical protein